ncbi:MAG: hypothetical protein AAFX02_07470 [Pseudomonadota bacterium]
MSRPRPKPPIEATLQFCVEQAEALERGPDHWRWLTIGLVMALQEACVIALTSYESASPEDILKPGSDQIASLKTLLRRVRSEDYLLPPEKLTASESTVKKALELQAARNIFSHLAPGTQRPNFTELAELARAVLDLLQHFLVQHPAFDEPELSGTAKKQTSTIRTLIQ